MGKKGRKLSISFKKNVVDRIQGEDSYTETKRINLNPLIEGSQSLTMIDHEHVFISVRVFQIGKKNVK